MKDSRLGGLGDSEPEAAAVASYSLEWYSQVLQEVVRRESQWLVSPAHCHVIMIALVQVVLSRMGVVWPQYVGVYEPRIVVIEKVERIFRLHLDSYFLYSLFAGIQQNKSWCCWYKTSVYCVVLIVLLFRRCATSHLWPFKHGRLSLRTALKRV